MNEPPSMPVEPRSAWPDAMAAAAVLAVDPAGIGGVLLHARPGPAREAWLERLAELLPTGTRTKRMPLHIDDARLLGGLDLAATLHAGRPVAQRGLLSEADGGVLIVAMAERLSASAAAQLAAALDTHEVALQRDGLAQCHAARFGVVALDEGDGDEERAPAALADRLALHVDLSEVGWRETLSALDAWDAADVQAARERLPRVEASAEIVEALCAAALALGVYSLRAPLFALRVAQIAAALAGREVVSTEDAALAARWVLAPRATRLPAAQQEASPEEAEPNEPDARADGQPADDLQTDTDETKQAPPIPDQPLEDVVLEAAQAAIPAGLLERLMALGRAQSATSTSGRAGEAQFSRLRGRPLGARRGEPRSGARLDLIATLRTAAPWQTLRRRERTLLPRPSGERGGAVALLAKAAGPHPNPPPAGEGVTRAVISAHIGAVRFQRCPVLIDIDIAIPAGRWTAIVGPNGAGKSTLLRTLAGLLPCEGEVRFRDRPLAAWPAKERAREMAWLGQGETGADDLRAHDVVMLGRLPHQAWLASPSAADEAAAQHAMEQTQSWPWRERRFGSLSGGERQRVLLARALAVQAPVLLMDEPLAHLDAPHQADWLLIVRELTARGVAVVSVLHELGIALQADALVVMDKGRVVHHGAPAEATTHAALQQVFEQRLKFVQIDGQWWALPCSAHPSGERIG